MATECWWKHAPPRYVRGRQTRSLREIFADMCNEAPPAQWRFLVRDKREEGGFIPFTSPAKSGGGEEDDEFLASGDSDAEESDDDALAREGSSSGAATRHDGVSVVQLLRVADGTREKGEMLLLDGRRQHRLRHTSASVAILDQRYYELLIDTQQNMLMPFGQVDIKVSLNADAWVIPITLLRHVHCAVRRMRGAFPG